MRTFDFLGTFLGQMIGQAPLLLAYLAGLGLAAFTWQRHPKVSLLAALASIIFILNAIINIAFTVSLPQLIFEMGLSGSEINGLLVSRSICTSLVTAVTWGLVLAAIFGWRKAHETDSNPPD